MHMHNNNNMLHVTCPCPCSMYMLHVPMSMSMYLTGIAITWRRLREYFFTVAASDITMHYCTGPGTSTAFN